MRTLAVPIVAVAVLMASAACADSPTQVQSPNTPTLAAAVVSTGGLDFSRELGDIHTRYLPTFDDQEAAARLQTEMDVITERLAAGDVDSVRAAIGRARDLLVPGVAHPVDLYALRRTFDVLESYLQ